MCTCIPSYYEHLCHLAVPPKCAFVPGLIPSSTRSPRVKYHHPSLYPPTTPTRTSSQFFNTQTLAGLMTAGKPLCSSPLAGPPASFDTGSDSDSDSDENPSSPVSPVNSDQPSLSWNISPALSPINPYSSFELKSPASVIPSISASMASRGPRVRVRVPCPPPKCHLHPRNTVINNADNDPFMIHDLTRSEPDTLLARYKCTCKQNDSNAKKSVLRKKRSSSTSPTSNPSTPKSSTPPSSLAHSRDQKKSTRMGTGTEMNEIDRDTARSGPRPGMRSIEDIASEREMKKSLFEGRELEAGLEGCRRGTINMADGGLRDCVDAGDGVGSGVEVPVFRLVVDNEDDGADGRQHVKECAGELRRGIRPGELRYGGVGPGTLEGARRSEGRVWGGGSPVSLHVVAEGESWRRRDEWEMDLASSSSSLRRREDNRRMTMKELGMGSVGGSNRKRNVAEGPRTMSTLNEWEEFGVLKPPSRHLLSALPAVSGAWKEPSLDTMRRKSMAHSFTTRRTTRVDLLSSSTSSVPSNLFNLPTTPPSKRFSASTSSPLSTPSHSPESLFFSVSSTTSRSPSSPTPRPKRTTPSNNSWYTANTWGEIPKFTRLGLSAPGVVLPISAKEHMRLKRVHATSPTDRRWSNFPSSNSSSCSSLAHTSVSASQEKNYKGAETDLEGKTLSRSSSASATTSASSSSACWSACTTSTTTSPSPTSEENDSMERVLSMESAESVYDVAPKADTMAFDTVKQKYHANKPHRSVGFIKGLRGNLGAGHPCSAGAIHSHASSELTLAMGNVGNAGAEVASSSQSLVSSKLNSAIGVDHTLSTPSLGQYPSSYSISSAGQIGVGEGGKLRGESSVKRWWKSLVGGAR
ncbi:hypothetical protein BJ165DRAFT_1508017 [Panaeolus papilionaceus]|nr:hypothetical protein BJ165DRAFT_1508017 [Panaeolus papilionaceus]